MVKLIFFRAVINGNDKPVAYFRSHSSEPIIHREVDLNYLALGERKRVLRKLRCREGTSGPHKAVLRVESDVRLTRIGYAMNWERVEQLVGKVNPFIHRLSRVVPNTF